MYTCYKCKLETEDRNAFYWCSTTNTKNSHCKECEKKAGRERHSRRTKEEKDLIAFNRWKKKWGLPDTIAWQLVNKEIPCFICGSFEKVRVDHCHTSGKFRVFLCNACNLAAGKLESLARDYDRIISYFVVCKTKCKKE